MSLMPLTGFTLDQARPLCFRKEALEAGHFTIDGRNAGSAIKAHIVIAEAILAADRLDRLAAEKGNQVLRQLLAVFGDGSQVALGFEESRREGA